MCIAELQICTLPLSFFKENVPSLFPKAILPPRPHPSEEQENQNRLANYSYLSLPLSKCLLVIFFLKREFYFFSFPKVAHGDGPMEWALFFLGGWSSPALTRCQLGPLATLCNQACPTGAHVH